MLLFLLPIDVAFFDSQGLKLKSLLIKWSRRFFLGRCFSNPTHILTREEKNILHKIFQYFSFSKLKIFCTVKWHKIEGNVLIAFTNAFDTEQMIDKHNKIWFNFFGKSKNVDLKIKREKKKTSFNFM